MEQKDAAHKQHLFLESKYLILLGFSGDVHLPVLADFVIAK